MSDTVKVFCDACDACLFIARTGVTECACGVLHHFVGSDVE